MLTLVMGCAGTGKSTLLLEKIKQRAERGEYSVYLVPEQSSQAAEVLCFRALGPQLSRFCQPASFRTLAERIEAAAGGGAVPVVSDAARSVFVRRAVEALGDEVKYYRRHRRNTTFLTQCGELVQRFKMAGADAAALQKLASGGGERLSELALIYAAYEATLAGKAIDPEDRLSRAANRLPSELYASTTFFLDDFDGFTAPEYDLLRRLLAHSKGVTLALCCDGLSDPDEGLGLFSPVKQTAAKLIRMAKNENLPVGSPIILPRPLRAHAAGLSCTDALLRGQPVNRPDPTGVFYTEAADRYAECRLAAAKIRSLAMEGVPYNEMAVICRDTADYEPIVEEIFAQYDIPFFTDSNVTAQYTAPSAFLRAALELAKSGVSVKGLLSLVKSGLTGVGADAAAAFENYLFVWQPSSADLQKEFTLNPQGFGPIQPEDAEELALAEGVRARLLEKICPFIESTRRTDGEKLAKQLYLLLDAFDSANELQLMADSLTAAGNAAAGQDALRSWELSMDALDSMSRLLGTDSVSPAEFGELLDTLLRAGQVGNVPRTQNAVTLTGADRMRLDGPAHAFVLGLTEGDFPKGAAMSGLLSGQDRDYLAACGIELPGSFESKVLLEEMFFYRALTCSKDGLYLFSPSQVGGEAKTPCVAVSRLAEKLTPAALSLGEEELCGGKGAALARYAAAYTEDSSLRATLSVVLSEQEETVPALALLKNAAIPRSYHVGDAAVMGSLIGKRMGLSPSRIEQYYKCSYSYFLQYVLKLKARKPAELSPTQSGSFVHYILEKALGLLGDTFVDQTDEQLLNLAEKLAEEYIADNIPQSASASTRFAYLIGRIKRNTAKLLCFMREEQKQSSFVPEAFELKLGEEDVKALSLKTPDGKQISVSGTIDRVDVMHRDGHCYVRVVDYKTGNKTFALDEVYEGLDLQMLLYMFSVCDSSEGRFADAVPAGVVYLLADKNPELMERTKAASWIPTYQVDGLILDDEMVINAMDHEGGGVFIPVKRNKNGSLAKGSKVASLAKLGRIKQRIEELVIEMAGELYAGRVEPVPLITGKSPCEYCDYISVCRHEEGKNERSVRVKKDVFDKDAATDEEVSADAQMDAAAATGH